jgi:hypothetical protein
MGPKVMPMAKRLYDDIPPLRRGEKMHNDLS